MAIKPPVHRPTRARPPRHRSTRAVPAPTSRVGLAALSQTRDERVTGTLVQKFDYFKQLSQRQVERIARSIRVASVDAGTEVIKDGDIGDCMYLLLNGQVEVSKHLYMKGAEGFQEAQKAIVRLRSPESGDDRKFRCHDLVRSD